MKNNLKINKPLVSVNWLYQHKDATNLLVLDTTIKKVTSNESAPQSEKKQVKGARFFDLKKVFSNQHALLPNTCLSAEKFEEEARKIGINKNAAIIVYDAIGIYSAPRAWWLFKLMGFANVAVLDGGLPAWEKAGFSIESFATYSGKQGDFKSKYQKELMCDSSNVFSAISDATIQLLDARSKGRFYGTEPEPRAAIRGGRIPNSNSMPYGSLLEDGQMKSESNLRAIFKETNPGAKKMIFTCGSGITACVLALGAEMLKYTNYAVYDGSWTEWGSLYHLPIEK
ncbi:MAG: sulfurtransferase [Polaribacter sp.]|nr:sulfurtransferase [Polaribacter sp.]